MSLRFSKDLAATIGAFFLFMATAAYYNIPVPQYLSLSFGWEYGNIAEALVQGKGFANAFTNESGPTAWMPPLFIFIQAGVFYVFGIKTIASMWVIFLIKYIALAACFYMLLSISSYTSYSKYKYLLALIFLGLLYFNLGTYFKSIHDDWLNLFLSCLMLYVFTTRLYQPSRSNTVYLYILAFILPLTNPSLALAFLAVEAGVLLFHKPGHPASASRWFQTLIVLCFFASSTLLWTYRNYQVFGFFIPIKSNFWYDFYQANALDRDGLTTNGTFHMFHPVHRNQIQEKYLTEKETQFIEEYKELSFEWIRTHPSQLLQNIGRRAFSAFIYMHQSDDVLLANQDLFTPEDIKKLQREYLVSYHDPPFVNWTSLSMPQSEFEAIIHALEFSNEQDILQDWLARRNELADRFGDWKYILRSLLISFVPFLCLMVGLCIEKIRKKPAFIVAACVYLISLAPYVLVSHYRRYQVPLIGLQSIFIFFFICIVLEQFPFWEIWISKTRASKPEEQ